MSFRARAERFIQLPPQPFEGEVFIERPRVVRTTNFPRTYGGRLFVSDRRVHFAPDILNRLVGGKAWTAKWNQIRSVTVGEARRTTNGLLIFDIAFDTVRGDAETFTCRANNEGVAETLRRFHA